MQVGLNSACSLYQCFWWCSSRVSRTLYGTARVTQYFSHMYQRKKRKNNNVKDRGKARQGRGGQCQESPGHLFAGKKRKTSETWRRRVGCATQTRRNALAGQMAAKYRVPVPFPQRCRVHLKQYFPCQKLQRSHFLAPM